MLSTGKMQTSAIIAPTSLTGAHSSTIIVRPSSSSSLSSPTPTTTQQHFHSQQQQQQLPSPLSLGPTPPPPQSHQSVVCIDHATIGPVVPATVAPATVAHPSEEPMAAAAVPLARVRLADLVGYDGVPTLTYTRAVEALSGSLMRHNAVIIELGSEDCALMRCGLEAARLYFRTRAHNSSKGNRGIYMYRAGRALEDWDSSPPCMADIFRCLGKTSRTALSAIARHLRLRSDVFNHLLDDNPLPANEASSSMLVATYSTLPWQTNKSAVGGGKPSPNGDIEKGLLTLISSDYPGIQVCDPNNRWYLADDRSAPGDLLLITGKALSHATAGLRPAALYRAATDYSCGTASGGRTSLAFRLMPQSNAILDCSPIAAAGHVIPQSYVPISVSQFMDDLSAEEDIMCNHSENIYAEQNNLNRELSLRSILSDPLSGAFLEDAVVVSCGHSFGGLLLRKVMETARCTLCNAEIESSSLVPNHALRAAAAAVKQEDERRLFHNAALRKRRKEIGDHLDLAKRPYRENGDVAGDDALQKGVQYPFSVNEKVVIKGNRRTPDKFVGKEAIITSQCLNGWYLLKIIGSGESVRLQYRSLQKIVRAQDVGERHLSQPNQESG